MDPPLAGIRIVDLTRYLSGPYATMTLAELGADVIKIERPGTGDETRDAKPMSGGVSHYFASINRSKRSIELDIQSETGKEHLSNLIADSDVLIENFRPGVMESLGFGADEVLKNHPALVYCSISGFGNSGPAKHRVAFDLIMQGESGVMSLNGDADRPPAKLGLPIADLSAGMFAVQGILAALFRRTQIGRAHV